MKTCEEVLSWIDDQEAEMVALVRRWSEINSGSDNVAGLNTIRDELKKAFSPISESMSEPALPPRLTVDESGNQQEQEVANALHIRQRSGAKRKVMLSAHMDTVFPIDHPFQTVQESEPGILHGPGVSDIKGGIVVMLTSLRALERSPEATNIGWELFFNPDEEVGSMSSAPLIAEVAKGCEVGLVFEPSLPDGSFISERKGSANYVVVIRGRAAHVGREYEKGRNALVHLARFTEALEALREDGVVVNMGKIEGGGPTNVVPDLAIGRFNIRANDGASFERIEREVEALVERMNATEGFSVELTTIAHRAAKPFDERAQALFHSIRGCCEELNLPCNWKSSGGVCDGNIMAEAGLPTIDTLGVRGGKIHTADEFMIIESLVERAKLTALFLLRFASTIN